MMELFRFSERRLPTGDDAGADHVFRLRQLVGRNPIRADAIELNPDQAIHPAHRHALIHDAVGQPDAGTVARVYEGCPRRHRGLRAAHYGYIEPRALALPENRVEHLERRSIRVSMLRFFVEPEAGNEIGVRVRDFPAAGRGGWRFAAWRLRRRVAGHTGEVLIDEA